MLDLTIVAGDLSTDWEWSTFAHARSKRSAVKPFESPLLETSWGLAEGRLSVWVGEAAEPAGIHSVSNDEQVRQCREFDDGDAALITIDADPHEPRLRIARSRSGACPIYVVAQGDRLVATWDFERAVKSLERVEIDAAAARLYISSGPTLSRQQIFRGLFMLAPGEALTWAGSAASLSFQSVEAKRVVVPNTLRPDARATDEFARLIEASVSPLLDRARAPCIEISGGLDSSCVGVSIASRSTRLRSYGLIQLGIPGRQQRARRQELISLLGTSDVAVDAGLYGPFSALSMPGYSLTPVDEIYRSGIEAALDQLADSPPDLVLTGIGGNEVTMSRNYTQDELELTQSVPSSSVIAAMCRADMFLRRGTWVKNPFLDPHIVNFCRALPKEIRNGRLLHVLTLARAGLSDGFLFPAFRENFSSTFEWDLERFDASAFFRSSALHEHGVIDISTILQLARDVTNRKVERASALRVFTAAKLESVIRRYV